MIFRLLKSSNTSTVLPILSQLLHLKKYNELNDSSAILSAVYKFSKVKTMVKNSLVAVAVLFIVACSTEDTSNKSGGNQLDKTVSGATWPDYLSASRNDFPSWAGSLRRSDVTIEKVQKILEQGDLIHSLGTEGDFVSFFRQIELDGGESHKSAVYENAIAAADLESVTGNYHYFHVGNEISSRTKSESLHEWLNDGVDPVPFDVTYIPIYAEYMLATTVEAIFNARRDTGAKLYIALGSVTNASNPDARAWLDALASYEFKGTYAPSLTGLKVSDVVDYVTFHYTIHKSTWRESFDDISKWIGQGSIIGMMDTEEIGLQLIDAGASSTSAWLGFARFMSWVNGNRWAPDQVRMNYWSHGDEGADEAMQSLYEFTGNSALKNVDVTTDSAAESYAFDIGGERKFVIVAEPINSVDDQQINEIHIPLDDWTNATVEVEHRLLGGVVRNEAASITIAEDLVITTNVLVRAGESLMFKLTTIK